MSISDKRLRELERAEKKLVALEAGGVDNWEFYGESLREFHQEEVKEEVLDNFISHVEEYLLVEHVEVDYPAGREAGHSVTLTSVGEVEFKSMLNKLLEDLKQEGLA